MQMIVGVTFKTWGLKFYERFGRRSVSKEVFMEPSDLHPLERGFNAYESGIDEYDRVMGTGTGHDPVIVFM